MTEQPHDLHERDPHDAVGADHEHPAPGHGDDVHTHADGTTHAHPPHRHGKRPGFLARLFGAPG